MKWFGRTDNWNRKFSMKETLEKLLKGIQATWEKEEFDGGLSYSFKFQGGHFKALFQMIPRFFLSLSPSLPPLVSSIFMNYGKYVTNTI